MTLQVTCAIIADGSKVLCAQRGAHMALPLQWEFPGGKIEPHESAAACIVREIKEELALDIGVVAEGPRTVHPHRPSQMLELIPFVCRWTGGELCLREHAQAGWFTRREMVALQWAEADVQVLAWWLEWEAHFQAWIRGLM